MSNIVIDENYKYIGKSNGVRAYGSSFYYYILLYAKSYFNAEVGKHTVSVKMRLACDANATFYKWRTSGYVKIAGQYAIFWENQQIPSDAWDDSTSLTEDGETYNHWVDLMEGSIEIADGSYENGVKVDAFWQRLPISETPPNWLPSITEAIASVVVELPHMQDEEETPEPEEPPFEVKPTGKMLPILYRPEEKNFLSNGIGILSDCVSCFVSEEENGAFELEMQYPMDGIHYVDIVDRCVIKAKPNQEGKPQLFRVYSISKPMSGIVSVFAEHISYDLSGIPVSAFTAESASAAMDGLLQYAVVDCPFSFSTDKNSNAKFVADIPGSIRSKLGGVEGSILDVYGGEFEWDNFNVILHSSRGKNRGVSIRYGKNLTDIKQEQNCANVATGIYPYWLGVVDEKNILVELPEKIVNAPGNYGFVKIKTLDVSNEFSEPPTAEQLRGFTQNYIATNNIGIPTVSISVSYKQLEQSEGAGGVKFLEKVCLFDTVNVEFPALGVSATAKVAKVVYNVLLNRVENVVLGSVRSKISDTVASQQNQLSNVPTKAEAKVVGAMSGAAAANAVTAWLTNGYGYKVERLDLDGNSLDTLYMDTNNINTAVNIMRFDKGGISISNNGVNGAYRYVLSIDGKFFIDGKTTSWRDNGDGTHTLIGQ